MKIIMQVKNLLLVCLLMTGCAVTNGNSESYKLSDLSAQDLSSFSSAQINKISEMANTVWQVDETLDIGRGHYKEKDLFLVRTLASGKLDSFMFNNTRNRRGFIEYELLDNALYEIDISNQIIQLQFCFGGKKQAHEHFGRFVFNLENQNPTFTYKIVNLRNNDCPDDIMGDIFGDHGHGTGTGH